MSVQSIVYAGFTAAREAMEAQTKATLEIWKAFESFAAVLPKPTFDEMLALTNETTKFFTQQK